MIRAIKTHWPLMVALVVLWGTIIIAFNMVVRQTGGQVIYALDDSYIHMAMAKNIVQHGVWGVTRYDFSSACSSPLWLLFLSLIYFLFGVHEISPFILNVIMGSLTVILAYILLRKNKLHPLPILVVLWSIIFFTPLPSMVFAGMEHTLHILITIAFLFLTGEMLSREEREEWSLRESSLLLFLASLLATVRYEGLFLIACAAVLFAFKRRLKYSILLVGAAALPTIIYGLISVSHGWFFLPNSILLKGNVPKLTPAGAGQFLCGLAVRMMKKKYLLALGAGCFMIVFVFRFHRQKTIWKNSIVMFSLFSAATLLHLIFAQIGWFYRYEAYLIAAGILAIAIGTHEGFSDRQPFRFRQHNIPDYLMVAFFIFVITLPLVKRAIFSFREIPYATRNIYEQQYQMGLFLKQFYQGESIAANDIGAINYLADINCLDLYGLASREVAQAKISRSFDTRKVYDLSRQKAIKLTLVYDNWFIGCGGVPSQWVQCGQWKIMDNKVCGGDTVSFYATDPAEVNNLIRNLKAFSPYLPRNVIQLGAYTGRMEESEARSKLSGAIAS